jgi:hypothetical protein
MGPLIRSNLIYNPGPIFCVGNGSQTTRPIESPVPRRFYHNGPALGAQASERRISELVKEVGFRHFKRATQTPIKLIYEAKP